MTIMKISNGVLICDGDYIFAMKHTTLFQLDRDNIPAYHVTIYHEHGGKIEDMFFSNCSAKTAWRNFYRIARRNARYGNAWYGNGR